MPSPGFLLTATIRREEERRLREYDEASAKESVDFVGAWVAARRYVEARIDEGSVADFGDVDREYQNPRERIREIGEDRYEATGWVDVADAEGDTTRLDFRVPLKQDFVDRSWRLDGEPTLTPRTASPDGD